MPNQNEKGPRTNPKLRVITLEQMRDELARKRRDRAGQVGPEAPKKSHHKKSRPNRSDTGPAPITSPQTVSHAERQAQYRKTVAAIDTLFKANKMQPDFHDTDNMFEHLSTLPGFGVFRREFFGKNGVKLRNGLSEKLLSREEMPTIGIGFWKKAKKIVGDRSFAEALPGFWDEYITNYQQVEPPSELVSRAKTPLPKRRPGRPPVEPRGGVDAIRRSRGLEIASASTTNVALAGNVGPTEVLSPNNSEPTEATSDNSYVGPEGYRQFFHDIKPLEAQTVLSMVGPTQSRQFIARWEEETEPSPVDLPEGWVFEDGRIDLPDGRRLVVDMDSYRLTIIGTARSLGHGETANLELVRRSANQASNTELLQNEFPFLNTYQQELVNQQLSRAAFARKMVQVDGWLEEDNGNLADLRVEIGQAAVRLAVKQTKAEKLWRRRTAKQEFLEAADQYYALQERYLRALRDEHSAEADSTERDVMVLSQIINMNQVVEDARSKQMTGFRAKFRSFWQKHPKTRIAVSVALTGVAAASAATGIVPVAIGAASLKKALGAYGTYVGTENTWLGINQSLNKRGHKKAAKAGEQNLTNISDLVPEMATRVNAVLAHLDDEKSRQFILAHLAEVQDYLNLGNIDTEASILSGLIESQKSQLESDQKSARIGKGLGMFTAALFTGVGLIPWNHEAASGTSGREIGQAARAQAQPAGPSTVVSQATEHLPTKPSLTPEQLQKAKVIFADWTPQKDQAFNNMFKILGPNPSQETVNNFNRLFS